MSRSFYNIFEIKDESQLQVDGPCGPHVAGQCTFLKRKFLSDGEGGLWIKLKDKYITKLVEALNLDSNKGKARAYYEQLSERFGIRLADKGAGQDIQNLCGNTSLHGMRGARYSRSYPCTGFNSDQTR